MEYDFRNIEKKWQQKWKETNAYKVSNDSPKPKCYVLDMFPYPSGAGLHVGHPLGYIASDIYARYKRLKGFNVLHPMGYDSFGLPAEQYALETGQHPAVTTENNINTFRQQLDNIGFSFDWSREVRTSDPKFYKWTQWIFLQLFNSYFCNTEKKALPISTLIKKYATKGAVPKSGLPIAGKHFTAEQWNAYSEKEQQDILMNRRLAYLAYGEVNWCEALGTVLANDEVINGVSERGGHPVVKKKMHQWYLRITEYAERLLQGLETVEFTDAMKEMQRNWIGRSEGAEIEFRLTPNPSPYGEGNDLSLSGHFFQTADIKNWTVLKDLSRENRKEKTVAEDILWQELRNNKLGYKVRRQHVIEGFIIDFAFLQKKLLIEIDGGYHEDEEQKAYDDARAEFLMVYGYRVLRFANEQVLTEKDNVIKTIKQELEQPESIRTPLSERRGAGGEAQKLKVYTTRPDTIFGVDFMVLAPEHELVKEIVSKEQQQTIDEYLTYVKSRSERERLAEVKQITGAFTGAYAVNPFDGREIPIWISEYVLAGYGTGAIMAVPCGDQRDFNFAKHFGISITNIIGDYFNGEEANPTKEAILSNSDFLNGILMEDAIGIVTDKLEELGIGKIKINYKMRDAGFSRQRYWGEPFPIVYKDGIAYVVDERELPVELPHVENYQAGPEGEGPLANIPEWALIPSPSPQVEKGTGKSIPKYSVSTPMQYELAKCMRKEFTEAEDKLWQLLRNNQLGVKFRRQHPIDAYIADFISLQNHLIIEVDGGYHNTKEQKVYDENRTKALEEIGFDIVRFSNDEILGNAFKVRGKIKELVAASSSTRGEGLGVRETGGEGEIKRETNTMPGYAGSSWYFLRYTDPHNDNEFASKTATDYWNQVDVYVGGTEHAVGHLLYSRMWTKVLFDLGLISFDEPYRKLVNQGMIQGSSRFVYSVVDLFFYNSNWPLVNYNIPPLLISFEIYNKLTNDISEENKKILDKVCDLIESYDFLATIKEDNPSDDIGQNKLSDVVENLKISKIHVNVNLVDGVELNINEFRKSRPEYANATFILEDGKVLSFGEDLGEVNSKYICGVETEKMSKSKYNTVNPDMLIEKYGADTFRMYEMFLGPVEQSKPWDTKGIEGVHRFLKKLWRLFYDDIKGKVWTEENPTDAELKVLHKTIKKIEEDTERFSYNTAVSAFMVCVNELHDLKCHKKEILEKLLILLTPYAPHVSEELWHRLKVSPEWGDLEVASILDASFPTFDPKYLIESSKEYPISINGKMRTVININLDATEDDVKKIVLENEVMKKWIEDKPIKKLIFVKNKMVNVVM